MLGDYGVIDHHSVSQLLDDSLFYLHKNTDSNAEIVVDIMRCVGAPIMERTAIALMIGIVTDTGHFKHASVRLVSGDRTLNRAEWSQLQRGDGLACGHAAGALDAACGSRGGTPGRD